MPDQLTYVGHSTLLVELGGVRILTDPVLRERIAHIRRRVPAPAVEELLPLDAVLISHAHADHLDVPSLRRVAGAGQVIAPLGCAATIRRAGTDGVVELTVGGTCAVGPVGIEVVPAEHDGRRYPLGPRIPSLGFLLDGPTRIYFAGDTDLFDGMARLAGASTSPCSRSLGGARGSRPAIYPESAARAVALIRPSVAVPIHWGTMRSVGARPDPDPRRPRSPSRPRWRNTRRRRPCASSCRGRR